MRAGIRSLISRGIKELRWKAAGKTLERMRDIIITGSCYARDNEYVIIGEWLGFWIEFFHRFTTFFLRHQPSLSAGAALSGFDTPPKKEEKKRA